MFEALLLTAPFIMVFANSDASESLPTSFPWGEQSKTFVIVYKKIFILGEKLDFYLIFKNVSLSLKSNT